MDKYNQLMLKFWGIVSIILPVVITYFVITEGFQKWGQYYILAIFTVLMYLVRKWMMKRMEKHLKFLEEEAKSKPEN
jgi:Ca2+/H+ antiporter